MFEFVQFLADGISDIGGTLNGYQFNIAGVNVSILDIFIGLIAMGLIITVFWKGSHT